MKKFTKEQTKAIITEGSNIIVSAGAGSGKTTVLTERVITKLKKGIKINELLILTFTNLAAQEMKERIRKEIYSYDDLKDNLNYLENAYITTFDSYTLSLIKKYHYLLNISPNVSIISSSVINIIKNDYLDEVFLELYNENNSLFQKLINDLTNKNDTNLKDAIKDIILKIDLKSNKEAFLDNYLEEYLSDEKINYYIEEYNKLIQREINSIETNLMSIADSSYYEYYEALVNSLDKLIKSKSYDEVRRNIYVNLPKRPKSSDDIKIYKDNISDAIENINDYLRFTDEKEIKEIFTILKDYSKIIIEIIKRYYHKLNNYKRINDLYEFNDIEIMAINLLKEHQSVCDELKNYYNEILVDEYQDTNDLQEEFINLISNNNVYMVGDIKQSIYGFRNANPDIFRHKYNKYSQNDGGIKIDLLANFRSRSEVIDVINEIFTRIMDEDIGNANYRVDHLMQFGNQDYVENKAEQNYDLEILNYQNEDKKYKNAEIEAFIIGKDILAKINNHYQVYDSNIKSLRNITYSDICIIMDRGKNFNLYQIIFEYLGIPLVIYEDKTLTNETDIMLISNIIDFIIHIKNNNFDADAIYDYLSIARSFLVTLSDEEIFKTIKDKSYVNTSIYERCLDISKVLDTLDSEELIKIIIDKFNFYEKLITLSNIEEVLIRMDNLLNIARDTSKMNYTIEDFSLYLKKMIKGNDEIKYSAKIGNDGVKIMNIHKSKGLEFPLCYYASLREEFNTDDLKKRYLFDNTYGIITPFFKDGLGISILKDLYKDKYLKNDISEKIRLFYVALTRAKEKIIIVTSLNNVDDVNKDIVDNNIRMHYNSLNSILGSIYYNLSKYIHNINLNNINITKDYLYKKNKTYLSNNTNKDSISYREVIIDNEVKNTLKASSEVSKIMNIKEKENIDLGLKVHKFFEQTDFFNIKNDNPYKDKINNFVKLLNIKPTDKLYKETEFIFEEDGNTYNGIIDLIIVSDDNIKIVDYKLKNIDNPKYIKQLNVYYKYLKSICNKEIEMYLYSIINDELKKVSTM